MSSIIHAQHCSIIVIVVGDILFVAHREGYSTLTGPRDHKQRAAIGQRGRRRRCLLYTSPSPRD